VPAAELEQLKPERFDLGQDPVAAVAYADLGRSMAWQGRLGEAEG
jgi:hypothetical protein